MTHYLYINYHFFSLAHYCLPFPPWYEFLCIPAVPREGKTCFQLYTAISKGLEEKMLLVGDVVEVC